MADQQDGGEREPQPIDEEAAWAAIVAGYGDEPADPPGARPYRPIENLALPEPEDEPAKPGTGPGTGTGTGTGTGAGTKAGTGSGTSADAGADSEAASGADSDTGDTASGSGTVPGGDSASGTDAEASADADRKPEAGAGAEKPVLGSSIVFAPGVRPSGGPRDYSPAEPEEGAAGGEEGHFVPPEPPPLPEADATTKFAWLGVVGGPVLMLVAVLLQWDMTWWLTTLCVGGFLGGFATLVARMKHDDDDDDGFGDPGRGAVV